MISANDGRQAWDLLQASDCLFVITDWEMPEMNGINRVRKIRASNRAGYIYSILLTLKSERESVVTRLTRVVKKLAHRDSWGLVT